MMELRAQLELVNAIIQSFNQLRLIQLTAQAEGLADVQQMEMLTQIIQKSFTALTEIDASLIDYQHRLDELGFEDLAGEVRSYELIEDLVRAVLGRIEKGVVGFGEQSRSNQETGRSP